MRGRFITLEGGEGAGKSTQTSLLAAALRARGIGVLQTREPGGAPGAEALRGLLLSQGIDWSPLAETLLHFAARAEHVAKTIRPALESGRWVICDRYYDSTMAYQGYGQGQDRAVIAQLADMIDLVPDLTLVLTVAPEIAEARLKARGLAADRYDALGAGFHARVAEGFVRIGLANPERCRFIDAGGGVEETQALILAAAGRLEA